MATLADLRKRLRGIQTICQLAGAMRTVSSAKLARINASAYAFSAYAQGCRELLEASGAVIRPVKEAAREALSLAEAVLDEKEKEYLKSLNDVITYEGIFHVPSDQA